MDKLVGILERIVFENPETGYTIARLTSRDYPTELITVVGNLAAASAGESLALSGEWVNNPQYGRQFKIEGYETVLPATVVGLRKYLGSGMNKGVGPVMQRESSMSSGWNTMDIIEQDPREVTRGSGNRQKNVSVR